LYGSKGTFVVNDAADTITAAATVELDDGDGISNSGGVHIGQDTETCTIQAEAGGTASFTGADIDYQANAVTLARLTYNPAVSLASSESITLGDDCVFASSMTIAGEFDMNSKNMSVSDFMDIDGGTLNAGTGTSTIYIGGDWDNTGTFTYGSSIVEFDGGSATITTSGTGSGKRFYDFKVSGATKTLSGNLDADHDITITGTVAQGSNNIYCSGDWDSETGTVTLSGDPVTYFDGGDNTEIKAKETEKHFGYIWIEKDSIGDTLTFTGDAKCTHLYGSKGTFVVNDAADTITATGVYYALVNSGLTMSNGTINVNANAAQAAFLWRSVTENITGGQIIVSAGGTSNPVIDIESGDFTPSGGAVVLDYAGDQYIEFDDADSAFYNLTLSGSGTKYIHSGSAVDLAVSNQLTINANVTLNTNAELLTVGGNFTINSSGALSNASGTITFDMATDTTSEITANAQNFGAVVMDDAGSSGTLTLLDEMTTGTFTLTDGAFEQSQSGTPDLTTGGLVTVGADATWTNNGDGDVILGGNVDNEG